jgi:hypothetical protein
MNIYIVKATDERSGDHDFRFNLTTTGVLHSVGRLVYDYLDETQDYHTTNPASSLTEQDITNALKTGQPIIVLHPFKVYVTLDILGP